MQVNEAGWDRIARMLLGVALIWVGFLSGMLASPWSWVAGGVGLVMIFTAILGFCPAYAIFGVGTCRTRTV
jgi:hypothetical protein